MADDIDYFKNRYPELKAFLEATEENELERLARGLKSDYLGSYHGLLYSALSIIAMFGSLSHLNALIKKDQDSNENVLVRDNYPLRLAAAGGHLEVVNRLLEFEAVKNAVAAHANAPLRLAAAGGHLEVVNRLLEFEAVKNAVDAYDNGALRVASEGGHLEVVNRLLEFEAVKNAVAADDNEALKLASARGHLEVVNRLLEFEAVKDAVAAENNGALRFAGEGGHLEVVNRLLEFEAVKDAVAAENNGALRFAGEGGHLEVVNRLLEFEAVKNEVAAENNGALRFAGEGGHLEVVNRLLEFEAVKNAVAANGNEAFRWAVNGGHLAVVNRLLEFEAVKNEFAQPNNYVLRLAAAGGHLAVVNRLLEFEAVKNEFAAHANAPLGMAAAGGHLAVVNRLLEFEAVKNAVAAENNGALGLAAEGGHLEVVNRLLEFEAVKNEVAVNANAALTLAAKGGHLEVVNRLLEFEAVKNAVAAEDNYALRKAAAGGHLAVVNRLLEFEAVKNAVDADDNEALQLASEGRHLAVVDVLLHYPEVFRHAESHEVEYGRYVNPFISTRLELLRQQKQTFEQENPYADFNIENSQEAQLYYYFIRNLIRQGTPESLAGIQLLLDIPSVQTLAHTESNGLLRLASREGDQAAAAILLQIPAVRELAVQNNFYQHEARGEFNLREVAQDRESSMRGLTVGERKHLEAVEKRYGMKYDESLVAFKELYAELTARYEKNPAFFTNDQGERISLPLTWEDFNKLTLSEIERKEALKAYYQHPEHTAIRYLSKHNHWMAEKAAYVDHNEAETEFWPTFQQYIPLITMLWRAAKDKDIAPIDNYTVETRVEHFIKELALIGRAHNWDRTRVREKDGKTEEYDDLQGDKPSCYSGVKRRLFQSVQGHPLMKMLTQEVVREELREFVRQSFHASIGVGQGEFKRAHDDYVIKRDDAALEKLKELNISEDAQTAFIVELGKKYGDQFKDDPAFKRSIEDYFKLGDENKNCHAIKLGWVGLWVDLDDVQKKSALVAGSMFKPEATHGDHGEDKPKSPRP